ncbi:hypothetical protein, partial [Natrinema soli]
ARDGLRRGPARRLGGRTVTGDACASSEKTDRRHARDRIRRIDASDTDDASGTNGGNRLIQVIR